MKNQQENNLNNAQNELKKIQQMAQQFKGKAEFAKEFGNLDKLQQMAQNAEQQIQNAKNQNK